MSTPEIIYIDSLPWEEQVGRPKVIAADGTGGIEVARDPDFGTASVSWKGARRPTLIRPGPQLVGLVRWERV